MAAQICPNCKKDSFTWGMDEDESRSIRSYHCGGYEAWEDEFS